MTEEITEEEKKEAVFRLYRKVADDIEVVYDRFISDNRATVNPAGVFNETVRKRAKEQNICSEKLYIGLVKVYCSYALKNSNDKVSNLIYLGVQHL